mgnify:FL=1
MARKKSKPSVRIEYDMLSDELKKMYDEIYLTLKKKNIFELRQEAQELSIGAPTRLQKAELVRRMADKLVSDYVPEDMTQVENEVKGIYFNGYLDDIVVPKALIERWKLRDGDVITGTYAKSESCGYVMIGINKTEHDISADRPRFEQLQAQAGEKMILCNAAKAKFPGLKKGERVLMSSFTAEEGKKISEWFENCLFIPIGVLPESKFNDEQFAVPFDMSAEDSTKTVLTAVSRAKRLCEEGKDVVIVASGLSLLGDRDAERAVFGVGRNFNYGRITVIADEDKEKENGAYAKAATRII